MTWPVDSEKLDRVRALMRDQELDALVVRAPDNVLYLTNYWCMKGYDLAVFPREGDPALIVIEPQAADAHRMAWTDDIRLFRFYDERDPRPPTARSLSAALQLLKERDLGRRVGIELENGSQAADRMVAEPTVYTSSYFEAFRAACGTVLDAMPLLVQAR